MKLIRVEAERSQGWVKGREKVMKVNDEYPASISSFVVPFR